MPRNQPPVLSPLTPAALFRAALASFSPNDRARRELTELLVTDFAADGVMLTSSGTDALTIAIQAACDSARGARIVALPAFSCYDVASAAVGAHVKIVLYDLDPDTLAPELSSFETALRHGARAAVVAPLYGIPVAWEPLEQLAARHDATLIEDAAQGHGARWKGRPLGSLGRSSVLSFGRGKGWTGGGGGALLRRSASADHSLAQKRALRGPTPLASVAAFVKAAAQWALARPSLYGVPSALPWLGLGETQYRSPSPPRLMGANVAALVLATRTAAASEAQARRQRAATLRDGVGSFLRTVGVPDDGTPGYLRLPVRLEGARSTQALVQALRPLGVAASYPTTLADVPEVRPFLLPDQTVLLPGAATLVRELFTLPTHSLLTDTDIDRIVDSIERFVVAHAAAVR